MWKDWTPEKIWKVVRIPLLFLVLAVLLRVIYQDTWWAHAFFHMLLDAIAVGIVIGLTIELFFSGALIEHTSLQLSEKLVGMGLPKDLQGVIGNIVHHTSIVHQDSSVTFDIQPDPDNPELVLVTIEREYKTYNYGKTTEEYTPKLGDEHFHEPQFLSLDCIHGDVAYHLSAEELSKRTTTGEESRSRDVKGDPINLDPYELRMGFEYQPCSVTWKLRKKMPKNYSEVVIFSAPTVGGFQVRKGPIHPTFEFEARRIEGHTVTVDGGNIWKYTCAFIPRQFIKVWWRPRQTTTGASA